jgi:PIN domain nuclease of toxin-antitoxin system
VIVLDTHVWVWWVNGDALPARVRRHIAEAIKERALYVSSISAWEVAQLAQRGRLQLTMEVTEWIAKSEALPFLHFVPVNNPIAVRAVHLPEPLHRDPADRIILATALTLGFPLATRDRRLRRYPHVPTLW